MNRIAELRKSKKISQSELGKIVGAAQNTICNWENGLRQPDNDTIKKLSDFFGVTTDYLLGYDEDIPEDLIILNRNAKKLSPEQRKQLLDMARVMFKEEFDE